MEKPALTNKAARELFTCLEEGLRFEGAEALLPYIFPKTATIGDYAGADSLCALIEPRSLMDNMTHEKERMDERLSASSFPIQGLYTEPLAVTFGRGERATYLSIMQVGSASDDDLPVKRTDVAGVPERLFGKLRTWTEARYLCLLSVPDGRAREGLKLELVDHGLPIRDVADETGRTRRPFAGEW